MQILDFLKQFFDDLISLLFPNKCAGCGKIIEEKDYLCVHCYNNIEKINKDKYCLSCGYDKENCICKSRVFRFEKIICVFKNEGIAQRAYYRYKFAHRTNYTEFFAQQISLDVLNLYNDIKFDYICNVPTSKRSIRKYGFDHTAELCRKLSRILKIPYMEKVLICDNYSPSQHYSSFKQRLINIRDKYTINKEIRGNVLLIDDIRTTGATLDECAKMLLYAGADRVYCATALTTMLKNKKDELQKK